MIISKTVSDLPPVVSAPTIGITAATQHLVRHRHLFDEFVSSLHAAGVDRSSKKETRAPRISL